MSPFHTRTAPAPSARAAFESPPAVPSSSRSSHTAICASRAKARTSSARWYVFSAMGPPATRTRSTMCARIGLSPTGSIGFAHHAERGRRRVPRPAQSSITAATTLS